MHLTLTLGGGARVYVCVYDPQYGRWEIKLTTWNGTPYNQSKGITIWADTTEAMASNCHHWIGITAPYGPVAEELESSFPVRITRFREDEMPTEEAIVHVGTLTGKGGELWEMAHRAEMEVTRVFTESGGTPTPKAVATK